MKNTIVSRFIFGLMAICTLCIAFIPQSAEGRWFPVTKNGNYAGCMHQNNNTGKLKLHEHTPEWLCDWLSTAPIGGNGTVVLGSVLDHQDASDLLTNGGYTFMGGVELKAFIEEEQIEDFMPEELIDELAVNPEYVIVISVRGGEGMDEMESANIDFVDLNIPATSYDKRSVPVNVSTGEGLQYNYPNPFSTETTFRLQLQENASVRIRVYTLTGLEVDSFSAQFPAGPQQLRWDATDAAGNRLEAGTYLYKIEIGTEVMIGKMHIMP